MPLINHREEIWPGIPLEAWRDTHDTLHRWLQIIGKIRLRLTPLVNHWWNVPLYVTARGLTTSPIPYADQIFQIDFDFIDHEMRIVAESGDARSVKLKPQSVADFYHATMDALNSLGIEVHIWTTPVEVPDQTPFEQDTRHGQYDPEHVHSFWLALVQAERLMEKFRSRFIGKDSPVHFFWGGLDMAVTRFSGRRAPEHPGFQYVGRSVMLEAYSHEVSSCGFWPGTNLGEPAFYAYAYPEPAGFKEYPVEPKGASYNPDLGEFVLPYEKVRKSDSPDELVLSFFQSTYEAAANLSKWDRASLERRPQ